MRFDKELQGNSVITRTCEREAVFFPVFRLIDTVADDGFNEVLTKVSARVHLTW